MELEAGAMTAPESKIEGRTHGKRKTPVPDCIGAPFCIGLTYAG
jgi:hypothetical protein